MSTPADDGYAKAVIDAVQHVTMLVEEHKAAGEESRQRLQETVQTTVASMRSDVHKAITSLQISQADHKNAHEADRVERVGRQKQVDDQLAEIRQQVNTAIADLRRDVADQGKELRNWLIGTLVGVVAIGFFLIGWLVF